MKTFDRKFGNEFFASLPQSPGIYRFYNEGGELIYVGKAKNLKRRLGQYRNAKRIKKHRKMQKILSYASRVEIEVFGSDLEAILQETSWIQRVRPKWNVAGAFYFLYPMIGVRVEEGHIHFCYTSQPELFSGFEFHGAFRSREITGAAFFALVKLLRLIGHESKGNRKPARGSYLFRFRQLPLDWAQSWAAFLRGESRAALETLAVALLENAWARRNAVEIEDLLRALVRFWKYEAKRLAKARRAVGYSEYPVSQTERDLLFVKYRYQRASSASDATP